MNASVVPTDKQCSVVVCVLHDYITDDDDDDTSWPPLNSHGEHGT